MTPQEIAARAVSAILQGTDLTLHLPTGEKFPKGWPRGELLSMNDKGKNFSFDPLKILGFMQKLAKLDSII